VSTPGRTLGPRQPLANPEPAQHALPHPRTHTWILLGLAAGACAGLAWYVAAPSHNGLLLALSCAITMIPFGCAHLAAPQRILQPISLLGFTMLLGIVGQTAFLLMAATPQEADDLLSGVGTDGLARGLLATAAATVALGIGFLAASPVKRSSALVQVFASMPRPKADRLDWIIAILLLVGFLSFALYVATVGASSPAELFTSRKRFGEVSGEPTSHGHLRLGISMASIAGMLAVYALAERLAPMRSRTGLLAALSFVITFTAAFFTSSRASLFFPLLICLITAISVRAREPRPTVLALAVGIAVFSLAVLADARATGQGASTDTERHSILKTVVAGRQWMDIGPISAVITKVPDAVPYQRGWSLVSWTWAPIPRVLWPEKPPVRLAPEISPAVFGYTHRRKTGDPPGYFAELWLNGGLLALCTGAFILGALLRWIDGFRVHAPGTHGITALPYAVLMAVFGLSLPIGDVTGSVMLLASTLPFLLAAVWLSTRGQPAATTGLVPHQNGA